MRSSTFGTHLACSRILWKIAHNNGKRLAATAELATIMLGSFNLKPSNSEDFRERIAKSAKAH